jgi:methionyl-tRNA formyltransferase
MKYFYLFGHGAVLTEALHKLAKEANTKVYVLTSERQYSAELHRTCDSYAVEYRILEDLRAEYLEFPAGIDHELLGLSFGAPWKFSKEIIDFFTGNLYNLHSLPLPIYRGGASFSWQILNQSKIGTCLIHQVNEFYDEGKIAAFESFRYSQAAKIPLHYENELLEKNKLFIRNFIDHLLSGNDIELTGQPHYLSTYFPRLNTDVHGYINWGWENREIHNFICAFDMPYKGASTFYRGKRVHIRNVDIDLSDGNFHSFLSGLIYRIEKSEIYVATAGGSLVIKEINDESGNSIFNEILVGDRFYSPSEKLENAMRTRTFFNAKGLLNKLY